MTAAVQWQKINGRAATLFSQRDFFTNVQCFLETKSDDRTPYGRVQLQKITANGYLV